MPLVKFKRHFYAPRPHGKRFRAGIHEVPEAIIPLLPTSAEILDPNTQLPVEKPKATTLRDLDGARQASEEEQRIRDDAYEERDRQEEEREYRRKKFQEELEADEKSPAKRGRSRPKKEK